MSRELTEPVCSKWEGPYSGLVGLFLAFCLTKWGNPVIMDGQIGVPSNRLELALAPWPVLWGYVAVAILAALSLGWLRWQTHLPKAWLFCPIIWVLWQFVSAISTLNGGLTAATLPHFASGIVLLFIGIFAFARIQQLLPFWVGLMGGVGVIICVGLRQHLGGLEETRQFLQSLPDWRALPSDFLARISSNRIYSTFVYPNAFAGGLLLTMPIAVGVLARWTRSMPFAFRVAIGAVLVSLGFACLYWSGSKAGWLIAVVQSLVALTRIPVSRRSRFALIAFIVVVSVTALAVRERAYIAKGATSVSARFEYWRVAWLTVTDFPGLGSGPGTFVVRFKTLKAPDAEMTRLVHNDFLQQASDSGIVGGIAYLLFWVGGLGMLYRNSWSDLLVFCAFLGLLGFVIQSFVEFGLYIPGLFWPACLLLGWSLGRGNRFDKSVEPS